jgi:HSP20 family molecular chaperone IbpA
MSNIAIQRLGDTARKTLPVFNELARQIDGVRRRAFELFEKRGCELGHALDDWLKAEREIAGWTAAELKEKEGVYEIQMTLPGYDAKDVEVTATPAELIVHASYEHQKKGEEGKVLWSEFGSNEVYRCFEPPSPIDVDRVGAKLDKGILRITAPRAVAVKAKPVAVAAA